MSYQRSFRSRRWQSDDWLSVVLQSADSECLVVVFLFLVGFELFDCLLEECSWTDGRTGMTSDGDADLVLSKYLLGMFTVLPRPFTEQQQTTIINHNNWKQ